MFSGCTNLNFAESSSQNFNLNYITDTSDKQSAVAHMFNDSTPTAGKYYLMGSSVTPTYTVSAAAGITHGAVTVPTNGVTAGTVVGFFATPVIGYCLDTLTVTGGGAAVPVSSQGNYFWFTMPAGNVTVNAAFGDYVASGGGQNFTSLEDALAAVTAGTIQLAADVAIQNLVSFGTEQVLDLNGHTLTIDNGMEFGGKIKDAAGGGLLKLNNTGSFDECLTGHLAENVLPICTDSSTAGYNGYSLVPCTPADYQFGYSSSKGMSGFAFKVTMSKSDWQKLNSDNHCVTFSISLNIGGSSKTVQFSNASVKAAAAATGSKSEEQVTLYFTVWFSGTDALTQALTIYATPRLSVFLGTTGTRLFTETLSELHETYVVAS